MTSLLPSPLFGTAGFRTGDLGYLDPEEYLFIAVRIKDVIIGGTAGLACRS